MAKLNYGKQVDRLCAQARKASLAIGDSAEVAGLRAEIVRAAMAADSTACGSDAATRDLRRLGRKLARALGEQARAGDN